MGIRFVMAIAVLLGFGSICSAADDQPLLVRSPTLSKTVIVFAYGGYLWSVSREGGNARQLTTGGHEAGPEFSPDGKWIAFLSDRDGWDHLYVMPSAGGEAIQITKGKFEAWRPTWSPDSTRIAFDANEPDHYGDRHLYVATIGTSPARATSQAGQRLMTSILACRIPRVAPQMHGVCHWGSGGGQFARVRPWPRRLASALPATSCSPS